VAASPRRIPLRPASLETRTALIEAAARVFVERGFHGATVREIADSAGFTNPALYYHFGGKQDLYEAVIRSAFDRFKALHAEALAGESEPIGRLNAIAAAHLRFGRDDPIRLRVLYAELFRPRGSDADDSLGFDELRDWTLAQIEGVLRDGVASGAFRLEDVPLARRIFVALLRGLLVEQARDPRLPLLDDALAEVVVKTFLRGISSPETAS